MTRGGLVAEEEARDVDGIAADVHEPAAAVLGDIADVRGVDVVIAEEALDGTQFADAAGGDEFSGAQPLGMGAYHEGFADLDFGTGLNVEECAGFGEGEAERLFAEDVLPCFGSLDRPGDVKVVWERVVDDVNLRVGQELFVGTVDLFDPKGVGCFFCFGVVARGDRGDVG